MQKHLCRSPFKTLVFVEALSRKKNAESVWVASGISI
jgi:hypothetical protein